MRHAEPVWALLDHQPPSSLLPANSDGCTQRRARRGPLLLAAHLDQDAAAYEAKLAEHAAERCYLPRIPPAARRASFSAACQQQLCMPGILLQPCLHCSERSSAPRTALHCWTGAHPSSGVMAVSSFSSSAAWCALAGAACHGGRPGSAAVPCTVHGWPASSAQVSVHSPSVQPHLSLRLHRA